MKRISDLTWYSYVVLLSTNQNMLMFLNRFIARRNELGTVHWRFLLRLLTVCSDRSLCLLNRV